MTARYKAHNLLAYPKPTGLRGGMVRATTGRHDRANIPASARALIHTLRLVVAA